MHHIISFSYATSSMVKKQIVKHKQQYYWAFYFKTLKAFLHSSTITHFHQLQLKKQAKQTVINPLNFQTSTTGFFKALLLREFSAPQQDSLNKSHCHSIFQNLFFVLLSLSNTTSQTRHMTNGNLEYPQHESEN